MYKFLFIVKISEGGQTMVKFKKALCLLLTFLFVFSACMVYLPSIASARTIKKPKIVLTTSMKTQYSVGDKVIFQVKCPNYTGKVQYRAILWDGTRKVQKELWPNIRGYYYNKSYKGTQAFRAGWANLTEGVYSITILVKRAGVKVSYDSYVKITFKINPKGLALNKDGMTYGSQDSKTPLNFTGDINITANNVTLKNINVNGTVIINPGKDGAAYLENVKASTVKVLSGGKNSIHLDNTVVKILSVDNVNVDSPVRVETTGTTTIDTTTAASYVIFDEVTGSLGTINITKSEYGDTIVEFRGNFDQKITVDDSAKLVSAAGTSISNIEIAPTNNNAKVELSGLFDNVDINKETSLLIDDNSSITGKLTVADSADITASKTAVINQTEIAPDNKDDKIELSGTFGNVQLTKPAELAVDKDTTIDTVKVIEGVTAVLTVGENAEVKTLENNGSTQLSGEGTVTNTTGTGTTTGSTQGGSIPIIIFPGGGGIVIPTYDANTALNTELNSIITAANGYDLTKTVFGSISSLPANGQNNTINLNVNSLYSNYNVEGIFNLTRNRIISHGMITNTKDQNSLKLISDLLNNIKIDANGVSNTAASYLAGKTTSKPKLSAFLGNPNETTYNAVYDALTNPVTKDQYDTYSEAAAMLQMLIPGKDVTLSNVSIQGLTVDSVTINNNTIYSTIDKTITLDEIKTALGVATTAPNLGSMPIKNLSSIKVVMKDSSNNLYNYTINYNFN